MSAKLGKSVPDSISLVACCRGWRYGDRTKSEGAFMRPASQLVDDGVLVEVVKP